MAVRVSATAKVLGALAYTELELDMHSYHRQLLLRRGLPDKFN